MSVSSEEVRPKKRVSVVMPCFNEEGNVAEAVAQVRAVMATLPAYDYEHLFIDNASTDNTAEILRGICAEDSRVKLIINSRNFGHIRSPVHGVLQASGDVVVCLPSDMQEPPALIPALLAEWEKGYRSVLTVKRSTHDTFVLGSARKLYYHLVNRLSDIELVKDATGFGLFDASVIAILREIHDYYPYFRGLVCEIGAPVGRVYYDQQQRVRGFTKNNFYTLFDVAMLGITSHSRVPLRMATFMGFGLSALSLFAAIGYLIAKLVFWSQFPLGTAPLLIGVFTISSVQLFFIGLLGEYIGSIHTQLLRRPLVVERERVNLPSAGTPHVP